MSMMDEKRYVLIPAAEVTGEMLQNTIPYGIGYVQMLFLINGVNYEVLKWRNDKPVQLWHEYPVYTNIEVNDYIATHATLPPPPQPS